MLLGSANLRTNPVPVAQPPSWQLQSRCPRAIASSTSNGAGPQLMAPPTNGATGHVSHFADPEPPSEDVAQKMQEEGYDLSRSGLRFLSNEARVRTS